MNWLSFVGFTILFSVSTRADDFGSFNWGSGGFDTGFSSSSWGSGGFDTGFSSFGTSSNSWLGGSSFDYSFGSSGTSDIFGLSNYGSIGSDPFGIGSYSFTGNSFDTYSGYGSPNYYSNSLLDNYSNSLLANSYAYTSPTFTSYLGTLPDFSYESLTNTYLNTATPYSYSSGTSGFYGPGGNYSGDNLLTLSSAWDPNFMGPPPSNYWVNIQSGIPGQPDNSEFRTDGININLSDYKITGTIDPSGLAAAQASGEGQVLRLDSLMFVLATGIEQKLFTPEQLATAIQTTKTAILSTLTATASGDDLAALDQAGERYVSQIEALQRFADGGYQGYLDLPALGQTMSVSSVNGYRMEQGGENVWVQFSQANNRITVTREDETTVQYKLSDFVKGNGLVTPVADGATSLSVTDLSAVTADVLRQAGQAETQWSQAGQTGVSEDVVVGTSAWNEALGSEAVGTAVVQNTDVALSVARGTAAAIDMFGREAVENAIEANPDIAVKGASAIDRAREAGYDDETIKQYIASNPDWYNWTP